MRIASVWGCVFPAAAHLLLVATGVAIIEALLDVRSNSCLLDTVEGERGSLIGGLWVCANAVLGASVNRKTLAALKLIPLPQGAKLVLTSDSQASGKQLHRV